MENRVVSPREVQGVRAMSLGTTRKATLVGLLLLLVLSAVPMVFFGLKLRGFYLDVLGDLESLPRISRLAIWAAKFWIVVPLALLLLHLWSHRPRVHPRTRQRVWLWTIRLGFGSLMVMWVSTFFLFSPMLNLVVSL